MDGRRLRATPHEDGGLNATPDDVLDEWFSDPERWWKKDPAFDAYLRDRFGALVEAALRGERDTWRDTPRGALALVIVLDQFTRNTFRDTPRMFAGDAKALGITRAAIGRGEDASLTDDERHFFYMPLMHSEDRGDQERSLAKYAEIGRGVDFAQSHADIVFRFGRYPHRNAILGRESTPEEQAFLEEPGSSF